VQAASDLPRTDALIMQGPHRFVPRLALGATVTLLALQSGETLVSHKSRSRSRGQRWRGS
jgi:hypothetical protein